jgi:hypothetical protein
MPMSLRQSLGQIGVERYRRAVPWPFLFRTALRESRPKQEVTNACNYFLFHLQWVGTLISREHAPTGAGTLDVGITFPDQFPTRA